MYLAKSLLESVSLLLPLLLGVAYLTVIERKVIGSIQRRISVNVVGPLGLLQPFADALKLLTKENLITSHSSKTIFLVSPIIVLLFSILGWFVIPIPYSLLDVNLSSAYSLALSSLAVYGILLAGWGANSKYAFLGSLRSTAQLISYELLFSTSLLIIVIAANSFNFNDIVEIQKAINYIIPFLPLFVIYLISSLAETNRAPFDNVEGESEIVAGFFAEHSSVPFVIFFLGEYNALLLISALTVLLFIGDYYIPFGLKTAFVSIIFVWVRATLPRFRFDLLLTFCWLKLLPFIVAFLLFEICLLVFFI